MENIKHNADKKQGVDLVDRVFPLADEAIEKAKSAGEAMWEKAKDKGENLLDEVESKGQEVMTQVKRYVQKNPGKSIGYAAAAGLFIGLLLKFRSRD